MTSPTPYRIVFGAALLGVTLAACGGENAAAKDADSAAPVTMTVGPENIALVVREQVSSGPGISGTLAAGAYRLPPVRFSFADGETYLFDREPIAADLVTFGKAYGVDLRAVIGYPAINGSILQLDYQTRRLRILSK